MGETALPQITLLDYLGYLKGSRETKTWHNITRALILSFRSQGQRADFHFIEESMRLFIYLVPETQLTLHTFLYNLSIPSFITHPFIHSFTTLY